MLREIYISPTVIRIVLEELLRWLKVRLHLVRQLQVL